MAECFHIHTFPWDWAGPERSYGRHPGEVFFDGPSKKGVGKFVKNEDLMKTKQHNRSRSEACNLTDSWEGGKQKSASLLE